MREFMDTILLLESERTLYHGTLVEYLPEIMAIGLQPRIGDFTRRAYDVYDDYGDVALPKLVFAADKASLRKCLSAIIGQMWVKNYPITDESFFRHAAIVVIRGNSDFDRREEDDDYWDADRRETVEPGDFFTDRSVYPDYALTGARLRAFLRRYGVWDSRLDVDGLQARVVASLIRKGATADEARLKAAAMTPYEQRAIAGEVRDPK